MQRRAWLFVRESVGIAESLLEASRNKRVNHGVTFLDSPGSGSYVDIEQGGDRAPLYLTRRALTPMFPIIVTPSHLSLSFDVTP